MHQKPAAALPSLSLLRCFEAAAKHQSFTAAAEELGLTQGAVSRQVKELEEQIGARLFRREGRGVRTTRAGDAFAGNLAADLSRLRQTVARAVAAGESRDLLSIAVLPTFADRWLIPRISDFRARNGNLELLMVSRSAPFDLAAEGVDLAIHFGEADWPGAQLTPLCPEDLIVVAAPSLLAGRSSAEPAEILDMPLLHISSRPGLWDQYRAASGAAGRAAGEGSYFDQFSLIISAAVSGLGAAILPAYLIEPELASGALVKLDDAGGSGGKSYYVAAPLGIPNPLAAKFTAWVRKQVSRKARPGA